MEDNRLMVDYGHNVSFEEYTVFRYSRFSGIVLTDLQLHNKNFIECTFCGLTFVGCAFTNCFFVGGTVLAVKFENCFFTHCRFDTSFMSHTSLKDCHTLDCRITDSAFQHTHFHESVFREDNYLRCSFNSCDKDKCSRVNCHITECFGLSKTCPEVGAFIGWKRLRGNIIAKIEIPAYAHLASRGSAVQIARSHLIFIIPMEQNILKLIMFLLFMIRNLFIRAGKWLTLTVLTKVEKRAAMAFTFSFRFKRQ